MRSKCQASITATECDSGALLRPTGANLFYLSLLGKMSLQEREAKPTYVSRPVIPGWAADEGGGGLAFDELHGHGWMESDGATGQNRGERRW